MDIETATPNATTVKALKAADKASKPKAKSKPKSKPKAKKAAPKRKPAPKKKASKPKAKKTGKAKKAAAVVTRPERLDLRLTKGEKAKLSAKAKATRRTITSVVQELIEKMK